MNQHDDWKMTGMELTTPSPLFPKEAAANPKLDSQYYACRVTVSNGDENYTHVLLIKQSTVTPLKEWRKPLIRKAITAAKRETNA